MLSFLAGVALGGRFIYFVLSDSGQGHVQSLVLAAVLLMGGLVIAVGALLADLIAANRRLLEELVWRDKAARKGLLESTHGSGIIKSDQSGTLDEPETVAEAHSRMAS